MSLENERLRILGMIDDGTITAEEALKLLGALDEEQTPIEFETRGSISHPQENVVCIPGGRCYTLDEFLRLKKPMIPKLILKGEAENAKS